MDLYGGAGGQAPVREVEFELTAEQHMLMGHVPICQGQSLDLTLETTVLLPDTGSECWFVVQPEPLAPRFVRIAPGTYAFSGQIEQADLYKEEGEEAAFLLVNCGNVPLRAICGPDVNGQLPWGTWETRYLTGISNVRGIVDDSYMSGIGKTVGATIWSISRLVLTPGDPHFGEWYESAELPLAPFSHDKIYVTARLHRDRV